ncbi:MAG: anhydro-N-acetylmuramic acid kinase [Planctomycetota bacterium]|nr:anhydro-N-acetylmuramic acid kinase [Planctomycetota bacterium]
MTFPNPQTRLALGVMTGTSLDGLDAALVSLEGAGLDLRAKLVRGKSASLGDLAGPLRNAAQQRPMTSGEFARLAFEFGELHAKVIGDMIAPNEYLDLIVVHGQTVFHEPPYSWQLINPAPIQHRFKCQVITDLRQADLAAGGQGAPITPLSDWVMFRSSDAARAIINLGGFCNITFLPRTEQRDTSSPTKAPPELQQVQGFDLCPCNQLLDAIAREAFGYAYDEQGRRASVGRAHDSLVKSLLALFESLQSQQRSLGTGDEAMAWVDSNLNAVPPADLAASACSGIGKAITESIQAFGLVHFPIEEIILAGGGTHNATLVKAIRAQANVKVDLSDDSDIPVDCREAMAMAILGAMKLDGVPITLPQVTGRTDRSERNITLSLPNKPTNQSIP